jgi:CTP synthase
MPYNSHFKYIFVSGGVLSGVGKGIVTASVALLLKSRGYKITVVKCENYLNIDSGLINPIEHGDPFLCEDGAETDMDIGTYEKFLDQDFSIKNFITMGQIYKAVIDRERNFGYNGEDVEAIPHVTDEIISRIQEAGKSEKAEIIIVELGGTVGEYQNVLYYEAARILEHVHSQDVVHIHVSYLPTPPHLGEPKTKPTQLSVKTLNSMGIQPDFIVARAIKRMDERRRERFSLFCSVKSEHIIDSPDLPSVYELPQLFSEQKFDSKILECLHMPLTPLLLNKWKKMVTQIKSPKEGEVTIGIVGKYFATGEYELKDSYAALFDALEHAVTFHNLKLNIVGINSETETNLDSKLAGVDGIIVPIGWGSRGVEGKISAIKYARTHKIPYLGLCYGMQLAVVEFARNVAHLKDANSVEIDPQTPYPVIHSIPLDPKYQRIKGNGTSMRLGGFDCVLKPNTAIFEYYDKYDEFKNKSERIVSERHRHRFEVNNEYRDLLEKQGLVFAGTSPDDFFVEMIELPKKIHPFFIGTQGHPEYKSRPTKPHALFLEFIRASYRLKTNLKPDTITP